jgi:hypothetical protein
VPSEPRKDIKEEALRLVLEANERGVPLRLVGGLAILVRAADAVRPELARSYDDIDLVTLKGCRASVSKLLVDLGYTQNERFNVINQTRLVFYDNQHERHADVFVGELRMCHRIPMTERILKETVTVPLAELLLTKLQIVELNDKDLADIYTLLYTHDVSDDDEGGINAAHVARLCAGNWGLWRTTKMNLERARARLAATGLGEPARDEIGRRIDRLWERIEAEPKSLRWKSRSRVGDRVRWYDEPEDMEHVRG